MPGARAFDLFTHTHWEHHPYRLPVHGRPETVARFDQAAIAEHQRKIVRADNLVIAVVGDVDPDETAARVTRHFAELGGDASLESSLPPLAPGRRAQGPSPGAPGDRLPRRRRS